MQHLQARARGVSRIVERAAPNLVDGPNGGSSADCGLRQRHERLLGRWVCSGRHRLNHIVQEGLAVRASFVDVRTSVEERLQRFGVPRTLQRRKAGAVARAKQLRPRGAESFDAVGARRAASRRCGTVKRGALEAVHCVGRHTAHQLPPHERAITSTGGGVQVDVHAANYLFTVL
eukprot:6803099-Prymnesium_polylepis.1